MITALATGIVFGLVPAFVSTSHANDALARRRTTRRRPPAARRAQHARRRRGSAIARAARRRRSADAQLPQAAERRPRLPRGRRAHGERAASAGAIRPHPGRAASSATLWPRIAGLPGVQHAAGASCLPVPFACIGTSFWRVDRPKPADGQLSSSQVRPITPGFFKTMGIPQVAGRDFADSDTVDSVPVAIVSEELVRQQFADGSPLGRRLRINVDHANGRDDVEWTIVGVVGNIRSTLDGPVRQTIFIPTTQRPGYAMTFFVRSQQDPTIARHQRHGPRAIERGGVAGGSPHARGCRRQHHRAAARDLGPASACSRSLRSHSRRSASTA